MQVIIDDHIDEVIAEKIKSLYRAMTMIGMIGEGYAKVHLEQAPRRIDTGRLRNSVTHRAEVDRVAIGTNVEYGRFVELGTSKMEPNPFLRSAVGDHIDEWRAIIEEQLKA